MSALEKIFVACVIFFVIDLTLVATTCFSVLLLVKKILLGKVEIKIADKKSLRRGFFRFTD